jgi:hypothetical protein
MDRIKRIFLVGESHAFELGVTGDEDSETSQALCYLVYPVYPCNYSSNVA